MRLVFSILLIVLCLLCVTVKSHEEQEHVGIRDVSPLLESDSIREMYAYYGNTSRNAYMRVRVKQVGNILTYAIEEQRGQDIIRKRVFLETLETEKKKLAEGVFDNSGFNSENYTLSLLEKHEGFSLVKITPKKKPGFLLDGHALLNRDREVIYSDGRLVNSPSFWIRDAFVSITFQILNGSRVPIHLESTGKIRLTGLKSFLSVKYTYTSVNEVKIDNQ